MTVAEIAEIQTLDAGTFNAKRLLELYDRVAEAPDAIDRLRRFVLDLAVRGRLVPQDPADEPAEELLKQIDGEGARMAKAGRVRQHKGDRKSKNMKGPFSLPDSWKWARLGAIGLVGSSSRVHQKDWTDSGVPFYRAREIVKLSQKGTVNNELYISEELFRTLTANGLIPEAGDIMITGVGTIGVAYAVSSCDRFYFKDASVLVFKNVFGLPATFLKIFCSSPYWFETIYESSMGTTVHTLTIARAKDVLVPLPPVAEQHRIVAKVDELMALLDRLEAARTERETTRDRLTAAALTRLTAPETIADDFPGFARFALDVLPALTTRPDQIQALRQTILNLAVRGKLVEQDPNDEPAEELLERVAAEKARLEKSGQIRKQKPSAALLPEERFFQKPKGWVWTRLIGIGVTQTGTSPSSSNADLFGDFIPFIKPADLDGDAIDCSGPGLSREGIKHSRIAPANSVMMVCIGATLGKVNVTDRDVCFNQQINSITPYLGGMHGYLCIALKSSDFREAAWARAGTGTLPIISKGKWEVLPIPLPPVAEQRRIVAKVDELMTLCDRMEAALASVDTTRQRLLEGVVREALLPPVCLG
jgi:type I restriction enzyme, S subunit